MILIATTNSWRAVKQLSDWLTVIPQNIHSGMNWQAYVSSVAGVNERLDRVIAKKVLSKKDRFKALYNLIYG